MSSDILLSFIVPVYNVENILSRCLDSIINQSVKNFEIILVNDGSKDKSQDIIDKYVQDYPTLIKAFNTKNAGPGDTRNFGIKKSSGQYIAFVDSDDYLEPGYSKKVATIIDHHSPGMVIISYNRIYTKRQNVFERNYKFSLLQNYDKPVYIKKNPEVICKTEGAVWLKIVKSELFAKDRDMFFSSSKMGEDLEASLKWYLNVDKIIILNDKVYNYVINSNSLNFRANNIQDFISILESVCSYYKKNGMFLRCYTELEYLFAKHLLISNMLRLRVAKLKSKQELFMSLRTALLNYFPEYHKNKYLKSEPFYVRIAINLSYYGPSLFKLIL